MNRFASAARGWIGTPYVHQASCKNAGCDCLGLVRGIWRECLGEEPAPIPPYTHDWNEAPAREALLDEARRFLLERPKEIIRPGQVLLFRMRDGCVAKHLGVVASGAPTTRFVHAYSGHGVCETALTVPWRRRVVAVFDFPEET